MISASDILCFAGAGEGIFVAMQVLLKPGDHAIVLTPNYQSAETVPLSICDVSGVALDASQGWTLDLGRLRDAIRPNTRLVSINFPNNPTGAIPSGRILSALVDLCREKNLWLFSDEVYRGVETDPSRRMAQVADIYERGLSLNVMSKAYGLPGLRIGWIACRNRDLLGRMERYKHYLSICNSAPSEVLARIALKARDRILERNLGLIRRNIAAAQTFFARYPDRFEFSPPDGGCVCFVHYKGREGGNSPGNWSRRRASCCCHRASIDRRSARCQRTISDSASAARWSLKHLTQWTAGFGSNRRNPHRGRLFASMAPRRHAFLARKS
jgi:aspartate/methionine/tyrosine aminotransferase